MLDELIERADKEKLKLAPFIGIGCPGLIDEHGIDRSAAARTCRATGRASGFNLPRALRERMPRIGGHETVVVMHNDAVVQGLSEVPFMQDVEHWGVLTIGTGLGNARFTNRAEAAVRESKNGKWGVMGPRLCCC